jgi:hypothetical protein
MKRFKSTWQDQCFLSAHDQVANCFPRPPRARYRRKHRSGRTQAFVTWADVTSVAMAA